MSESVKVSVTIDGGAMEVDAGVTVAATLANIGAPSRRSVDGEPRTALCGMGVCHECRVTIDGRQHQRGCMTIVADGMSIVTHG